MIEVDPIDENMLHKILKDRRGLYREVILPSGEVWKDYESISFHTMPENERTESVTWALETLSKWIGIPVETLRHEDEADRQSVVSGKSVSVRLDIGCGGSIK